MNSIRSFAKKHPDIVKIVAICFILSVLSQIGLAFLGTGVLSAFGGSLGVLGIIGVTFFAVVGLVFQTFILTFVVCMFKFVAMPLLAGMSKQTSRQASDGPLTIVSRAHFFTSCENDLR